MWGAYPETNRKAERFFTAVFNIAARFMTNSFEWFNVETGDYLYTEVGAAYWTGPDSIRLGEEDPDFYPLVEMPGEHEAWYAAKAVPRITGMGRGKKKLRRGAGGTQS